MKNIGQYVRINNSTNFVKIDENNNNNINNNDNVIEIDSQNNIENFERISKNKDFNPYDDLYTFYKPFKLCNILFCKIGRNLCFGFNKDYEPIFVIGPHWYLFILLSIIIFIIVYFLFSHFIKIYVSYVNFFIIIFIFNILSFYI